MTRIYCKGELVDVTVADGWLVCTSCGKQLWRADATFALHGQRIASGHGDQIEGQAEAEDAAAADREGAAAS